MDIPLYLFRSLGKFSNKVQGRPEGSETSIFHHGLIKLLVVEELKKLNKYWTNFLFMSGYEVDAPTPNKTSKSKTVTPRKNMDTIAETEGDHQEGLQRSAEPMEIETKFIKEVAPQPTSSKHVIEFATISKSKPATKNPKRCTKDSTKGKGRLEDILQAIDIEETLVVKLVEVKGSKIKNNGLTAKKLDFSSEDSGFLFKPIKPLTRS